jgi:hypothetical protein
MENADVEVSSAARQAPAKFSGKKWRKILSKFTISHCGEKFDENWRSFRNSDFI